VGPAIVLSMACNGSRIKPSVTCDGLRAITLGMDRTTVEKVLGVPLVSTGRFKPFEGNPADEVWTYSSGNDDPYYLFSNSDKMSVDFLDGRLIRILAVRKLDQFPPEPLLFYLNNETATDGTRKEVRKEGRLFVEVFCPERLPAKVD
jgi:hypothetical protein